MTNVKPTENTTPGTARVAVEIPVDRVEPDPGQPRTVFDPDALDRLGRSLGAHGQIQPITVRRAEGPGRYVIVAGERRWRAAVRAGRPTVTALVVDGPTTGPDRLVIQLVENALRENLSAVEQARAYRTLMDHHGWSARQLAESLHLNNTTVSRVVRLLRLPDTVLAEVESGRLAPRTAYEIARLNDPEQQEALTARAVAEGLSRRDVIEIIANGGSCVDRQNDLDPDTYRVFTTPWGCLTIELSEPGELYVWMDVVIDVCEVLREELRASLPGAAVGS